MTEGGVLSVTIGSDCVLEGGVSENEKNRRFVTNRQGNRCGTGNQGIAILENAS